MKRRLFLFMGLFVLPLYAVAANIDVSIAPQTLRMNEAFQLTFTIKDSSDSVPDFSPLNEHFEVLNQRQSSQSSWANGRMTQSVSWALNLIARKQGPALIPAISIGQDASEPLKILIEAEQSIAIFLKVAANPKTPYIQSQIIYTWQFYRRADIEVTNARMNEPQVENAVRLQLGDNRQFSARVDDVEYVVTEGRYAIFPQKSGILRIPPLVLTAEIIDRDARNNGGFFRFQRSTARRAVSDELEVDVLPMPPSYSDSPWLAAQQLELTEKWSDEGLQLKVGESLTRTISLRATGVLKSQLPELNMALEEAGLTAYADQPLLAEQAFPEGVSSLREEKVAIIAARAGQYMLPAIEVSWFNTQTGKAQIARLDSRSLSVIETPGQLDTQRSQTALNSVQEASSPGAQEASEKHLQEQWFWKVLSVLLAGGWALTIVFWWMRKEKRLPVDNHRPSQGIAVKKLQHQLKVRCRENNAREARKALLAWCKLKYQGDTLSVMYPNCSVELQQQIALLERTLYSSSGVSWKGSDLWEAFQSSLGREGKPDKSQAPLEPLYPES